jgi:TetR/AcrR family transcriptional repressor of mexJK operon
VRRKDAEIVATARQLFLERGYDATSLDDVAAISGVSKTTVYNNFADKQALFSAVVLGVTANAEQILAELIRQLNGPAPVGERLTAIGRQLASGVLNPAVVQLRRLAIAEALRFPELVTSYWQRGPAQTITLLTEAFTAMDAAGELSCPDPTAAAVLFAYAIVAPGQDQALLQPNTTQTAAELDAHVGTVVTAFVRAYAPTVAPRKRVSSR